MAGIASRGRLPALALMVALAALSLILLRGSSSPRPTAVVPEAAGRAQPVGPICDQRLAVTGASDELEIPVCASVDLAVGDRTARRVVVVVHGDNRNATDYFDYVATARDRLPASDAVVVAPQFATRSDLASLDAADRILFWSSDGWKAGGESEASPADRSFRISSFDVMDQLVALVTDRRRFPNVRDLVVAGHSAGGQFVNRYSAASGFEAGLAGLGIAVRYVVANPSSYLYLDGRRFPDDGGELAEPSADDRERCAGYDRYKYGLRRLNEYVARRSTEALVAEFRDRHVVYALGALDTDPNASSIDASCAGRLQGPSRLTRGLNYYRFLTAYYGPSIADTQTLVVIPGIGHDGKAMLQAAELQPYLFGAAAP
jgi:hypothetical protein